MTPREQRLRQRIDQSVSVPKGRGGAPFVRLVALGKAPPGRLPQQINSVSATNRQPKGNHA